MRTNTFITLTLAMVYAAPSFATVAQLGKVTSQDNCGGFTTEVIEEKVYDDLGRGYIGESLRVFFDNFSLTTAKPGTFKRNCKLNAEVKVPAGYRFRPIMAAAEGFYNIQPKTQSTGAIKVSYVVQPSGQKAERTNPKPFTDKGDILCKAELEKPRFTTCYNKTNNVTLATDLGFTLNQSASGNSIMQLDATRTKTSLKWNWQFQTCENFYDQKWFSSSYKAYNGNTYKARMFFDVKNGRYESEAGFVGQLTNIEYSEDGLQLRALWKTETKSGWLSLNMDNVGSGHFSGQWGDSDGFLAPWSGQYENAKAAAPREYRAFHLANTAKCFDTGTSPGEGALLDLKSCNYKDPQIFYTTNSAKQVFFHIKSKVSGKCLAPSSTNSSALIVTVNCGASNLDNWEYEKRAQSPFRLKNKATGLCMNINDQTIGLASCDSSDASLITWSRQ